VVGWDLLVSTVDVSKEVLTPGDATDEGIIAVELGPAARDHFLLFVIAVTVTPGTAVVDTDPDTGTVYLHLLFMDRAEETAEALRDLARMADAALPVRSDRQTVGASS
jgi:multisubunit Na+/H+ antiporter MnhE subunit